MIEHASGLERQEATDVLEDFLREAHSPLNHVAKHDLPRASVQRSDEDGESMQEGIEHPVHGYKSSDPAGDSGGHRAHRFQASHYACSSRPVLV
jgi:hypothetical protein